LKARVRHLFAWLAAGWLAIPAMASTTDGQWELRIEGHQMFLYGERSFGGGIRIPWEVAIVFDVTGGVFGVGSGTARWIDDVRATSEPDGWFDCRQIDGSYLDRNLQIHTTPRVRFAAFPVAGRLDGDRVTLQPGYEPPGNYLAVTYRCETVQAVADNWYGLAERAKQVHGKRQDVEFRRSEGRQQVHIREVATLPPEHQIDLPLVDGWSFSEGGEDSERRVHYRLRRLD
jgi:hypothetical protein